MSIFAAIAASAGKARRVLLEDATFSDFDIAPSSAQTSAQITSAGAVNEVDSGTTLKFTWLLRGSGADYDVFVSATGDTADLSGSDVDTWLNLASSHQWFVSRTINGTSSVTLAVQIRQTSNDVVVATASWDLSATRSAA